MTDDRFDEDFDLDAEILDTDEDPFGDAKPASPALRTLEEFDAEVDRKITLLMAPRGDPGDRQEAALWLGESGAPKAITALRKIYEKDKKNPKVQQAAAYALGQFKALDQAIEREPGETVGEALNRAENRDVVKLLESIALYDERGRRPGSGRSWLVMLVLLLVTLGGLVVANLSLQGMNAGEAVKTAIRSTSGTPTERALDELGLRLAELQQDTRWLQNEFFSGRTEGLNCGIKFENPAEFIPDSAVAAALPIVQTITDDYNSALQTYQIARQPYDAACRDSAFVFEAEFELEVDASLATLAELTNTITSLIADVNGARGQLAATAAAEGQATLDAQATAELLKATTDADEATRAASTDEATPEPTEEPTSPMSAVDVRSQTGALYTLIDQATGQRGFVSQLNQYWTEVRDTGNTRGCSQEQPVIPEDYVLPENIIVQSPELVSATEQVNTGLRAARDGWAYFDRSCKNGAVAGNYQVGLSTTDLATLAFNEATRILDALTGGS